MTATELRKIAARVSYLRAHVELEVLGERDENHRVAMLRLIGALREGEWEITREANHAPVEERA